MAHDVFISYSTKDKTIADAVCAKLEENKIRVWIAPRDVPPGSNFAESIIKAINTCKVFILIWSANSNTSNHIMNEINQAFDHGITIIPFRIQDIQPTDEMRYYFGRTHWLDAIDPPLENHIAKLRDTILVNLGRDLQPAKPPVDSQESSREGIQPSEMPIIEKEPAIESEEATKHLPQPSHRTKRDAEAVPLQCSKALPTNITKYIPYAAGGLVVLTLIVLLVSGVFKGSPSSAVAIPTNTTRPTSTIGPTASSTPIPAWVEDANALAEPILAMINNLPPDFADDFSQVDPDWLYSLDNCPDIDSTPMRVADDSIHFTISPDCPLIGFTHPDFQVQSGDYVMQMDINFQQTNIGFEFAASFHNGFAVDFILWDDAWAAFKPIPNSNEMQTVGNEPVQSNASKPVTLTILKKGTAFLFYLNSELLTVYDIQEEAAYEHETGFAVNNWSDGPFEPETLLLDNFKVWDLDKIEESIELSESILAAVQDFPPDFADDFSLVDPDWLYNLNNCPDIDSTPMNVADGSIHFTISPDCPHIGFTHPNFQYQSGDYVMQMDINFQQTNLAFEFGASSPNGFAVDFTLNDYAWATYKPIPNSDGMQTAGNEPVQSNASKPVTLTIIKKGTAFLFHLNSELLTVYDIQAEVAYGHETGFAVNNWSCRDTCNPETFLIDNIKIWDLDKIEY